MGTLGSKSFKFPLQYVLGDYETYMRPCSGLSWAGQLDYARDLTEMPSDPIIATSDSGSDFLDGQSLDLAKGDPTCATTQT